MSAKQICAVKVLFAQLKTMLIAVPAHQDTNQTLHQRSDVQNFKTEKNAFQVNVS